jgi:signal transduction histidine kinase
MIKKDCIYYFLIALLLPFIFSEIKAQKLSPPLQKQADTYKDLADKARKVGNIPEELLQLNKLATLYKDNSLLSEAADYFEKVIKIEQKLGNTSDLMLVYQNLGAVYRDLGKYPKALTAFNENLSIQKRINNKIGICQALIDVATVQGYMKHSQEGVKNMEEALVIAKGLKDSKLLLMIYVKLSEYYKQSGDAGKSALYYQLYTTLRNKLQDEQINLDRQHKMAEEAEKRQRESDKQQREADKIKQQQLIKELEKDEKILKEQEKIARQQKMEIDLLNKQKQIDKMKLEAEEDDLREERLRSSLLLGIVVLVGFMAFILFRDIRKIRKLNSQLVAQNQEILEQKAEITLQNSRLDQSQRNLLDAKILIQEQNLKLQSYNRDLEKQVEERTSALQKAYTELLLINNDLDTLTYRASHDLKSPVASLDGLCNVALMEMTEDNPSTFYFTRIKDIAKNMASLLDGLARLRDIKHTDLKISDFSIKLAVNEVVKLETSYLNDFEKIQFITEISDSVSLKTDASLFKLIVKHILQNAVQFSLPLTDSHKPFIKITAESNETYTEVCIIDNGEGIPPDVAPKIFNMFYRGSVRSKGAGLGLYTCRAAIEKLEGDLEYRQNEQKNTVFSIRFIHVQNPAPEQVFVPKIVATGEFSA